MPDSKSWGGGDNLILCPPLSKSWGGYVPQIPPQGTPLEVTFQRKNGKSTIDYCIASPDFIPHIQDFQVDILDENLADKHSPIFLTLKTKLNENPINPNDIPHKTDINYDPLHSKWNEEKMPEFQRNFNQTKINNLLQILDYIEING